MKNAPDTSASAVNASSGEAHADAKQILLQEISAKWKRFSKEELVSLKDNDDFVSQVAAKYGLDRSDVQRDVNSFMNGRQI